MSNDFVARTFGNQVWALARWLTRGATSEEIYSRLAIYRPDLQSALEWLCEKPRRLSDVDHYGECEGQAMRDGQRYKPVVPESLYYGHSWGFLVKNGVNYQPQHDGTDTWMLTARWPSRFAELGRARVLVREERGQFGMQTFRQRPGRERWFARDIDRAVAIREWMTKERRRQWHMEQRGQGTPIIPAGQIEAVFGITMEAK